MSPKRRRPTALFAALAVVAAVLVPAWPAVAEDVPTPAPSSTATEAPAPDPTPPGTAIPVPDPTSTQQPAATAEPSATPSATPTSTPTGTPTPTPSAPTETTVLYTGVISQLSADGRPGYDPDVQTLDVAGSGLLLVDVAGVDLSDIRAGTTRLTLRVPPGLSLSDEPAARFDQLSEYSSAVAPLEVVDAAPGKQLVIGDTAALVSQTPNTPATHQVYAVLVSPSNAARDAVNQTESGVQSAVTAASAYWSAQSAGAITFAVAGTTSWYASANTCSTSAGSTALWNEARDVARTQLGYAPARNTHLVLFFPASASCGGAVGLGTIGWSVNQGGVAWVIGSTSATARQSTAHELGHNMSLGHASWADCGTSDPHPGYEGTTGCTVREYGDITDVMGFSTANRTGGALSSAQAIRSSIWPDTAWVAAEQGVHQYTIGSVSSHSGVRAVVVQDTDGAVYYVEYRDFTNEDAQYSGFGCSSAACVAAQSGVRILRLEHTNDFFQGLPGSDSYAFSRLVGAVKKLAYLPGDQFTTPNVYANTGLVIKVDSIDSGAGTATVTVTRPTQGATHPELGGAADIVDIAPVARYDGGMRVGDTWSVFLGDWWTADSYVATWYRVEQNGTETPVGSGFTYTLQPADLGHGIYVHVAAGELGADTDVYGPVQVPGYTPSDPGLVQVTRSGSTLQLSTSGWPAGTTFTCKWIRETVGPFMSPVAGATNCASYPLTVADRDKDIAVQATATVPYSGGGTYPPVMRQSPSTDYSITYDTTGTVTLGTPQVAVPLGVTNTNTYKTVDGPLSPNLIYTWFRNGVAIVGASGPGFSTYTPVAADVGTRLSVRVDASATGYITLTGTTSALSAPVLKGDIPFSSPPTITVGATQLQASAIAASSTEPGIAGVYQWLRGATVVATGPAYIPVAADYGQLLSVRLTLTKPGYTDRLLTSVAARYSVVPSAPGTIMIGGTPQVGQTLSVADIDYEDAGANPLAVQRSYQWLRNGIAIAGAVGSSYQLLAVDLGAAITVKVTARSAPLVPVTLTSPATPAVAKGVLVGTLDVNVTLGPSFKLTAVPSGVSAPTGTMVYTYQWYRQTGSSPPVPIAGAIAAAYTLTAADYNTRTFVRVTAGNLNYLPVVVDSAPHGYSVVASPLIPVLETEQRIGVDLVVGARDYTVDGVTVSPAVTYAWFRDGVAIPGTAGAGDAFRHYTPTAADAGKAITVMVTAAAPGMQSSVATSIPTQRLTAFSLDGWDAPLPDVVQTPGTLKLTLPGTGVTQPGTVSTYQWLRNGVAIAGATAATYTLTSLDTESLISVRAISSAPLYTSIVKYSPGVDYSISGTAPVTVSNVTNPGGAIRVGDDLGATLPSFATKDGPLTPAIFSYQWYRKVGTAAAVPIAGATGAHYIVASTDFGPTVAFSVTVTAANPGYLALTRPSVLTTPGVGAGQITGTHAAPTVVASTGGLLSAVLTPGAIDMPSPVLSYQWYRENGATDVLLGTASTYQLIPVNDGQPIYVKITATKANATASPFLLDPSAPVDYGIRATGPVTISMSDPAAPHVGDGILAQAPGFTDADGVPVSPLLSYQWARKLPAASAFTPIAGPLGTQATYTVTAADLGYQLQATVTAVVPGHIRKAVSASTAATLPGQIITDGGSAVVTLTAPATNDYTASLPAGTVTTAGTTLTYRWFRQGLATPIATTATYRLVTADAGKLVSAQVTISKPGFTSLVLTTAGTNYELHPDGTFTVTDEDGGAAETGDFVSAGVGMSFLTADDLTPVYTATYQWYRNGIAIAGATKQRYELTSADLGATVTVSESVKAPGYLPKTTPLAAAPGPITKGELQGSFTGAVVVPNGPGGLKVSLPSGYLVTSGVTVAYRWFRDGVLIPGATGATYALSAADASAAGISAELTFSKLNLLPPSDPALAMPRPAAPRDPRITIVQPSIITDPADLRVGRTLTVDPGASTDADGIPVAGATIQWMRQAGSAAPIAMAGATSATYVVQPTDLGMTFFARVTPIAPGSIALPVVSASTGPIQQGVFQGSFAPPTVTMNPATNTLIGSLTPGSITTPSPIVGYQWLRNGVVVIGTASTYKLAAADYGQQISLRVTVSRTQFAALPPLPESPSKNYSVVVDGGDPPTIAGAPRVGSRLTVDHGTYTDGSLDPLASTPVYSYTWYRQTGAVKVVVGTAPAYTPTAADKNATISVLVGINAPGYLGTSTQTAAVTVGAGLFQGTKSGPVVTITPATNTLTGALPVGSITDPSPVLGYQWLRNGLAIPGATASAYKLVALDGNADIRLRVTVTKAGYDTPEILTSPAESYTISLTGAPAIDGAMRVGTTASLASGLTWELRGSTIVPTLRYEWLRGTVLVGTGATYVIQPADVPASISLRITPSYPGGVYGGPVLVTAPRPATAGAFTGTPAAMVTVHKPTMTLTAALVPGSVSETGLALSYQWLRNGANIPGATASTYRLSDPADRLKDISVRITLSKLGYPITAVTSNPTGYTLQSASTVAITPGSPPGVGSILQLTSAGYLMTPSTVTYQWYRKTGSAAAVPIVGTLGTNPAYIVTAADTGSSIYAVVTGSLGGFLADIQTTAPIAVPGLPWSGTLAVPTVTMTNVATLTLTATLPTGSITSTPYASAWQWYRGATPIPGATLPTYRVTSADAGQAVFVRLTATKPLYDAQPLDSTATDYTLYPAPGTFELRGDIDSATQLSVGMPIRGGTDAPRNAAGAEVCCHFSTQWFRGTTLVGSGFQYTPTQSDVGQTLTEKITFTEPGYLPITITIPSAGVVAKGDYAAGHTANLTSSNMRLTATPPSVIYRWYPTLYFSGPTGFTYSYQWMRDSTPIAGATASSYQQTAAADKGHTIYAVITIRRAGYVDLLVETPHVNSTIANVVAPAISDSTPAVGDVLSIDPGDCEYNGAVFDCALSSPNPTYQWFVGGVAVPAAQGGTSATFTVPASAVGQVIAVTPSYPVPETFTTPIRTADTDPVAAS